MKGRVALVSKLPKFLGWGGQWSERLGSLYAIIGIAAIALVVFYQSRQPVIDLQSTPPDLTDIEAKAEFIEAIELAERGNVGTAAYDLGLIMRKYGNKILPKLREDIFKKRAELCLKAAREARRTTEQPGSLDMALCALHSADAMLKLTDDPEFFYFQSRGLEEIAFLRKYRGLVLPAEHNDPRLKKPLQAAMVAIGEACKRWEAEVDPRSRNQLRSPKVRYLSQYHHLEGELYKAGENYHGKNPCNPSGKTLKQRLDEKSDCLPLIGC